MSFPYPEPPQIGRAKWIRRIIVGAQTIIFIIVLVTTVVAGNDNEEETAPPEAPALTTVYHVSDMEMSTLDAYIRINCYDAEYTAANQTVPSADDTRSEHGSVSASLEGAAPVRTALTP